MAGEQCKGELPEEKAVGDLLYQNLQVLIEGVTATAVRHGDLRGITAQQARALANEAKRDVVENADRHGYYMHFATHVGQAPRQKRSLIRLSDELSC